LLRLTLFGGLYERDRDLDFLFGLKAFSVGLFLIGLLDAEGDPLRSNFLFYKLGLFLGGEIDLDTEADFF